MNNGWNRLEKKGETHEKMCEKRNYKSLVATCMFFSSRLYEKRNSWTTTSLWSALCFLFPLSLLSALLYCRAAEDIFCLYYFTPLAIQAGPYEFDDDGLDALYHHLVLALYEIERRITMKYSSSLCVSVPPHSHFNTCQRRSNPMIWLLIWSQIWA